MCTHVLHIIISWSQLYEYTADLLCLDFVRHPLEHQAASLTSVSTPLAVDQWSSILTSHSDRAFAHYICDSIRMGFRIGFDYTAQLKPATENVQSALTHPQVVSAYIQKELSLGRLLGPFMDTSDLPPLQFGVIPKGHNTGKWHLITDLSFPDGQSMNNGIDPTICSLHYTTVEDVAEIIATVGPGTLLAKFDIQSAYMQTNPCTLSRSSPPSRTMGRQHIRGSHALVRLAVSPEDF